MAEHTLVLRLAEGDDPTVRELLERCNAAADSFGGELAAWETGDALDRVRQLSEKLQELREELYAHGLLGQGGHSTEVSGVVAHPPSVPSAQDERGAGMAQALRSRLDGVPGMPPMAMLGGLVVDGLRSDLTQLALAVRETVESLERSGHRLPEPVQTRLRRVLRGGGPPDSPAT